MRAVSPCGMRTHRVGHRRRHREGADRAGNALQLAEDGVQVIGGVLAVNQQPVETDARQDLGDVRLTSAQPEADLRALLQQRLFEGVGRCFHEDAFCLLWVCIYTNLNAIAPSGP